MRTRDPFVEELAQTVNALFEGGKRDPSAEEIAAAHFPGKALGNDIIESIRKRLIRIREVLEQYHDLPVYLLSRTYYALHRRDDPPTTDADARRCVPGGPGVYAAGIGLHTDNADLIYRAWLEQNAVSAGGKVKKSFDRATVAVEEHRLEERTAARAVQAVRRRSLPKNPDLAGRLAALPENPEGLMLEDTEKA